MSLFILTISGTDRNQHELHRNSFNFKEFLILGVNMNASLIRSLRQARGADSLPKGKKSVAQLTRFDAVAFSLAVCFNLGDFSLLSKHLDFLASVENRAAGWLTLS